MTRKLGTWELPSGSMVDVYVESLGPVSRVRCEWDKYPPSEEDAQHYRDNVAPELTRILARRLGVDGRATHLRLGS